MESEIVTKTAETLAVGQAQQLVYEPMCYILHPVARDFRAPTLQKELLLP